MADIFVSYAREDHRHLERVVAAIETSGLTAWWDDHLTPRESWDSTVERQLHQAKAVVVLWTPNSVQSEWVRSEAAVAKGEGKLVPLLIEPCAIPLFFKLIQHADMTAWDGTTDDSSWGRVATWIQALMAPPDDPLDDVDPSETQYDEQEARFSQSIRERIAELNRNVDRLTRDQFGILKILGRTKRVRISGCAGSGKTLVASEKAIRCADAGLSTLFLCHSPHLADYVRDLIGDAAVRVISFSKWIQDVVAGEGLAAEHGWTKYDEPHEATLELAFDKILAGEKFDCVIVDEGQDFREEWWILVEAALASQDTSQFYIFHDDCQALLPFRSNYPFQDPVLNLSKNCRNAGRIFAAVRCFHAQAPEVDMALRGEGFISIFRNRSGDTEQTLNHALGALIESGHVHGRSVLLLAGGLQNTRFAGCALTSLGERIGRWQDFVSEYLNKAVTTFVTRGVETPRDEALELLHRLARLSDHAVPTRQDILLVSEVAKSIAIDERYARDLSERAAGGSLKLEWRLVDGRLRFRRALGGRMHGLEVLCFFRERSWADGLPEPRRWEFVDPADLELREAVMPVFTVDAFKGLEADTAILLIGNHKPVTEAEFYVAISRARLSLAIIDCSDGIAFGDRTRDVDFNIYDNLRKRDEYSPDTIDRYLDSKGRLFKIPSLPKERFAAMNYVISDLQSGEYYSLPEFD
ncbi:MAG: TIR domain-containing protein, partial [Pseudomonadota bacterium]